MNTRSSSSRSASAATGEPEPIPSTDCGEALRGLPTRLADVAALSSSCAHEHTAAMPVILDVSSDTSSDTDVSAASVPDSAAASTPFLSAFRRTDAPVDQTRFDIALYIRRINRNCGACKTCGKSVPWSRERVASHKARCSGSDEHDRALFASHMRMLNESKRKKRVLDAYGPVLPSKRLQVAQSSDTESSTSSFSTSSFSRPLSRTQTRPFASSWVDTLTVADKDRITEAFAGLFYRTGIPFNVAESHAMRNFISAVRPSYVRHIPKAKALSGTHLTNAYDKLVSKLNQSIADAPCYSLVSDGWSNTSNEHFVNYVVVIPGKQPFFYKSVSTSGTRQEGEVIADGIETVMMELGVDKCVSIVTDNAANMRSAWNTIETRYPRVFANGCASHVLNLLVKDLCNMDQFKVVVGNLTFVARFIKERQHVLAFFKEKNALYSNNRKLILPAPTRWFTQLNACERLIGAKFAVLSFLEQDAKEVLQHTKCQDTVKRFIQTIENGGFWKQLHQLEAALKFPSSLIGVMERDRTDISDIYHYFMRLYDHFSPSNEALKNLIGTTVLAEIRALVVARWEFIHTSSMGFAYMLSPAHSQGKWLPNDKADTRVQFKAYIRVFYMEDEKKIEKCLDELRDFFRLKLVSTPANFAEYASLSGIDYWVQYGVDEFPLLGDIAKRVFAVPTSSAAAERTWSAFSFLWSKRRNRLLSKKVERLVFLYTNYALLDDLDDRDYIKQLTLGEWLEDDEDQSEGVHERHL
jgi:hypothetical protein